jgi:hypothetical protein
MCTEKDVILLSDFIKKKKRKKKNVSLYLSEYCEQEEISIKQVVVTRKRQ